MRKHSRTVLALLLVLGLAVGAFALAGCKKSDSNDTGNDTSKAVKGGTLNYYINEPAYIDPYNVQESEGTIVTAQIFDSLTAFDSKTSKLIPAAAEKWSSNSDSTVWTFNLVKGAKFSDGTPVTAKDFKYAWERIVNPKTNPQDPSVISYHLAPVLGYEDYSTGKANDLAGVKVIDDYTLQVTLSAPFADFASVCAHTALAPVPKAEVDKGADKYSQMPVGNGPFKMTEPWKHNQYIKLARNDDYYGKKPYLDGVNFKIYDEVDTAYRDFEAGNLDFVQIPTGQIKDAETKYGTSSDGYTCEPGKQVLTGPEASIYYLVVNNKDAVMKNEKVREAVSYGVNRQAIIDTLFEGTRKPATGIVPPGIPGYQENAWPTSEYNVDKAKQALKDAGYPDGKGLTLTLSFNTGGDHQKIMEMVQGDLTKLGITVKMDSQEWKPYLARLQNLQYQIGRLGWIADYPIFDNFMYPNFYSTSGDNRSGYNDPKFDKDLMAARKISDETTRLKAYDALEKYVGSTTPVVPIMYYAHNRVSSQRVHDLVFSPMMLCNLEDVWLTNGGK